jgi:DNA-binding NtrC family response regulator
MKNWLSPATSKAHNLRGLYHQATAEHSPWRPIDAEQARPEYLDLIDVEILIPPLRDRLSDIRLLAQHFLNTMKFVGGDARSPNISPAATTILENCWWPMNVLDLRVRIQQLALVHPGGTIEPQHLSHLPLR